MHPLTALAAQVWDDIAALAAWVWSHIILVLGPVWNRITRITRMLPPWAALFGPPLGAGLLALYTRQSIPVPYRRFIAVLLVVVLAFALVRGGQWLLDELHRDSSGPPPWQKRTFAFAVLALLAALTVHRQWDGLLNGFHESGEPAFGVSAVAGLGAPWQRPAEMREALRTWSDFSQRDLRQERKPETLAEPKQVTVKKTTLDQNAALTVLAWDFGMDTFLLIPAAFLVLGFLIIWTAQAFQDQDTEIIRTLTAPRYERYQRLAKPAAIALLIALAADLTENYLAVTLTSDGWSQASLMQKEPNIPTVPAVILGTVTALKLFFFLIAVAYTGLLGAVLVRHGRDAAIEWSGVRGAWKTVLAVRLQALIIAAFAAALLVHEQVPDTIRRWRDEPWTGLASILLGLLLALAVWHSARWMIAYAGAPAATGPTHGAWQLAVLAGVIALLFGAPMQWWPTLRSSAVAILAGAVFLFSFFLIGIPARPEGPPPGGGKAVLPRMLGTAVIAILGFAVLRAFAVDFLYLGQLQGIGTARSLLFIALALTLLALSAFLYRVLRRRTTNADGGEIQPPASEKARWWPAAALLCFVGLWMSIMWLLYKGGQVLTPFAGAAGIVAAFLSLLVYTGSSVILVADRLVDAPAPVFRALGLRRTPTLTLVAIWFVLASALPFDERFHDLRPSGTPIAQEHASEDLTVAFDAWVRENCLLASRTIEDKDKTAVPLVLVAAAGGGIRAAVWTSHVLDQVLGFPQVDESLESADSKPRCPEGKRGHLAYPTYSHWVFAMSGVSGGSLGIAAYASEASLAPAERAPGFRWTEGDRWWIQERLGRDFLAPSLAWMLFAETPWSLLRFNGNRDRGEMLEQAWERPWEEGTGLRAGLFELRMRYPKIPLLVFNGSSVESGCRFQASVLNSSKRDSAAPSSRCVAPLEGEASDVDVLGATVDAVDFLCKGQDLPLAKSVLLSSRFPIVSPAALVTQCEKLGNDPRPATSVVDGGYLENSGAATALDLWLSLAPLVEDYNTSEKARACIVPFFVQVDTGYGEPAAPAKVRTPPQFVAPISAAQAARDGRTSGARQAAQIAFTEKFRLGVEKVTSAHKDPLDDELTDRYARFALFAHPGTQAPLGWTLSKASMQDLVDQFDVQENIKASTEFRNWFTGLSCTVR